VVKMTVSQLKFRAKELMQNVERASLSPMLECAVLVEREAKRLLSRTATRIQGPRGGKIVLPSPPGTPPRQRSGELMGSIGHARDGQSAIVGPGTRAVYPKVHEYGLEFGGRHFPQRPYMRPALSNTRHEFPKKFKGLKLRRTGK